MSDFHEHEIRGMKIKPCPLCGTDQVQVCTDANNPSKDYCRCRECKCTGPLARWQDRSSAISQAEAGEADQCSLCNGMGIIDGIGMTCPHCDGRGKEAPTHTAAVQPLTDEQLAEQFHRLYEEMAPSFGYATRPESAKPWAEVPAHNRALMTAVVTRIRSSLAPSPTTKES